MSDNKFELSRRRVLAGLGTIGVASAGAGAGTMAAFSDSESSDENTVKAGTLDLTIDGENGDASKTFTSELGPVAPGDTHDDHGGDQESTLKNTGTIAGYLNAQITATDHENGMNEPEEEDDDTEGGDLLSVLKLKVQFDDDGDLSSGASTVYDGYADDISETVVDHKLDAGHTSNLIIEWSVDDAGNEIQSDSAKIDVEVSLDQNEQSTE